MSLFDMAKQLLGENSEKLKALEAVSQLVGSKEGISSLSKMFEGKEASAAFQSWVGNGANLPISSDQLASVLGKERIAAISQKVGVTPEELQRKLSVVLPQVVNHLTPNGQINTENFTLKNVLEAGKAIFASN
jgi:uncharacterized protein YidB (DUF937 family)